MLIFYLSSIIFYFLSYFIMSISVQQIVYIYDEGRAQNFSTEKDA